MRFSSRTFLSLIVILLFGSARSLADCSFDIEKAKKEYFRVIDNSTMIDDSKYFSKDSEFRSEIIQHMKAINHHFYLDSVLLVLKKNVPCVAAISFETEDVEAAGIIVVSTKVFDTVRTKIPRITEYRIAAILAHESAHLQAGDNSKDATKIIQQELLADKAAGNYIGALLGPFHVRQLYVRDPDNFRFHCAVTPFMRRISAMFSKLANGAAAEPRHHGTPLQRENSFLQGILRSRESNEGDPDNYGSCKRDQALDEASIVGNGFSENKEAPSIFRGKWVKEEDLKFCREPGELEGITITNEKFKYNYFWDYCGITKFHSSGKKLNISASCLDVETDDYQPIELDVYQFENDKIRVQGSYIDKKISLFRCPQ